MFRSFLSRIFRFSNLTFKSLIHLELIFMSEGRKWLSLFFYLFSLHCVLKRLLFFSIDLPGFSLSNMSSSYMCLNLFLSSWFCSIDLFVFMPAYCFNYCGFIGSLKNQEMWCLLLLFFFPHFLGFGEYLVFCESVTVFKRETKFLI